MSPAKRRRNGYEEERRRAGARSALRRNCPQCGVEVLEGLDGDVLALTVRVDPTPVDAAQEVLAVAGGRASFESRRFRDKVELSRRDVWQWRGSPGTDRARKVLLAHRCDDPVPPPPQLELLDLLADAQDDHDGPPPF